VQDSMATAVSMGRILSVMVIFAAALPPAAGLATPAVLETVAVRGVASGGLRVAEGNADTIDSGARIWDSGREMAELLQQQGGALRGKRVLELGAGTGIGGLSAAACGAHVLLSDQAHMLPLLNENIAANGHMLQWRDAEAEAEGGAASAATADGRTDSAAGRTEGDFCGSGSAVATQLLWGDESDLERVGASGPFDLVVGSDLLYAPHVFPLLLDTLAALCSPERTEVLLTYPTRYTEDIFFRDAEMLFDVGYAEEIGCNVFATRMKLRASG